MSTTDITAKVQELKELETLAAELAAEIDTIKDTIKKEMNSRNVEEMEAGPFIIRWTSVMTQRFDSTAFKKVMPETYKAYTRQVTSRRFTVA